MKSILKFLLILLSPILIIVSLYFVIILTDLSYDKNTLSHEELSEKLGATPSYNNDKFRFNLEIENNSTLKFLPYDNTLLNQVYLEEDYDNNFINNCTSIKVNSKTIKYTSYFFTSEKEYLAVKINDSDYGIIEQTVPISKDKKEFIKSFGKEGDLLYCEPFTDDNFIFLRIKEIYYILDLDNKKVTYKYEYIEPYQEEHKVNIYNDTLIRCISADKFDPSSFNIYDKYGNFIKNVS